MRHILISATCLAAVLVLAACEGDDAGPSTPDAVASTPELPPPPPYPAIFGASCEDGDGDGHGPGCDLGEDCDQSDPTVFAGAPELPGDGRDNGCDGGGDLVPSDATGVFVKAGAPDDAPGTMAEPMGDLWLASLAARDPPRAVFVAGGGYALAVPELHVDLFGGYDPETWTRAPEQESIITTPFQLRVDEDKGIGARAIEGFTLPGEPGGTLGSTLRGCGTAVCVIKGNTIGVTGAGGNPTARALDVGPSDYGLIIANRFVLQGTASYNVVGVSVDASRRYSVIGNAFVTATQPPSATLVAGITVAREGRAYIAGNTLAALHGPSFVRPIRVAGAAIIVGNVLSARSGANRIPLDNLPLDSAGDAQIGAVVLRHNDLWLPDSACLVPEYEVDDCVRDLQRINRCEFAGCVEAEGNISANPLISDDVHLDPGSPCIDAGDPTWPVGALDIDGQPRSAGGGPDIGADEHH